MKKSLILIVVVLFYVQSIAQNVVNSDSTANLFNTQIKIFHSRIVDDNYRIFISLPDDYEKSDKKYPVLYLLDGDISYGMAAGISRYLQIGGNIPELIIVGIGYGALKEKDGNMRRRDYTISSVPGKSNRGGAPKFRTFLKEELIPYIDKTFRTDTNDRTIYGYSLGGLFAFYTLFTEPGLFNRYIIGSPHLLWDNFRIFDLQEEAFEKLDDLNANVFISVGSEEDEEKYFNPTDEMVTRLEEKNFRSLKLTTKVFDGGTHLIGPPEALAYGLIAVF